MISVENLTFGYSKEKPLFENLNIQLKPGNIYGLLGKNGAGKTSLLKILSGLLFPNSGNIDVFGNLPMQRKPDFLSEIFFLPEDFVLPELTIKKFVSLYHSNYTKFNLDKFSKFMEDFELSMNSSISNLSYGQKKRVFFSFGLAANTKLLLLDEPTNGLDIPSKAIFRKMLSSAITDDKIIIVSTHVVRDVENLIDPIIIVNDGNIIVNSEMFEISKSITMQFYPNVPADNVLYSEKVAGGYVGLIENKDGAEQQIDIEILFNAIHQNKKIIDIINKEGVYEG